MRISGGALRGRLVEVPGGPVRPSQERVREALFSMLADRVAGARFLDLFAGSGAVGIEAASRGAASVCWVEGNRRVADALRRNVAALCPMAGRVVADDVFRFLRRGAADGGFDIVFADPPYGGGLDDARRPGRGAPRGAPPAGGWAAALLPAIEETGMLAADGIVVIEEASGRRAAGESVGAWPGWRVLADRVYGDARLRLFGRARS